MSLHSELRNMKDSPHSRNIARLVGKTTRTDVAADIVLRWGPLPACAILDSIENLARARLIFEIIEKKGDGHAQQVVRLARALSLDVAQNGHQTARGRFP